MKSLYRKLSPFLYSLLIIIATLSAGHAVDAAQQGAADYRSSLTTGILSSDTSLTVVSTTTGTENLIQGATYGLKVGGREYVLGTLSSGKQFTGLTRGVSLLNGTTTGGTAQSWGRGTTVEITDAPSLLELLNKAGGRQNYDNALTYSSAVTSGVLSANGQNLASVAYANSLSFGAVAAANETTAGFVELSTQLEAASSTSTGGTAARLALGGNLATTTWNSATAANRIPVTGITGKLDNNFIATSTLFTNAQLATTTQIGAFSAFSGIGKQYQYITNTGTSSVAIPSGVTRIVVEICGAGSGGQDATSNPSAGNGGAAGGYSMKSIDVTGTSSVQVYVGATAAYGTPAAWTTFGTNGFYISAAGGSSQTGGTGTGGDLNISGQGGSTSLSTTYPGIGGSSMFGFGGASIGQTNTNGLPATGYCAGGSGAQESGSSKSGGVGTNGLIRINW